MGALMVQQTTTPPTWIDMYVAQAEAISPMTPTMFHESAALWLASVAIARRLVLKMAFGDVYPNLFIHWLAPTTLYRKTTALDVARNLALRTFSHLLAAQDTTPEAFLSDLAGQKPSNFANLDSHEQQEWQRSQNYAAQKGWVLDEMSGLLAASGRDYNAGLTEALIRCYDCRNRFKRSTKGQGHITVRNAYLSMLGASTPAAMAPHLTSERLWAMGFWSRFAILTPDGFPDWKEAQERNEPPALKAELQRLYSRLPTPAWPYPPEAKTVTLGSGVHDAWRVYNKTHSHTLLKTGKIDDKLFGTYGRLPGIALKVATILAALDWPHGLNAPTIEAAHMMRAISICEGWRASAHRAMTMAVTCEIDRLRARILRQLGMAGTQGMTFRDLYKALTDQKTQRIEDTLYQMVKNGEVIAKDWQSPKGGPKTKRFLLV